MHETKEGVRTGSSTSKFINISGVGPIQCCWKFNQRFCEETSSPGSSKL